MFEHDDWSDDNTCILTSYYHSLPCSHYHCGFLVVWILFLSHKINIKIILNHTLKLCHKSKWDEKKMWFIMILVCEEKRNRLRKINPNDAIRGKSLSNFMKYQMLNLIDTPQSPKVIINKWQRI